jgi:hypothetical protein
MTARTSARMNAISRCLGLVDDAAPHRVFWLNPGDQVPEDVGARDLFVSWRPTHDQHDEDLQTHDSVGAKERPDTLH